MYRLLLTEKVELVGPDYFGRPSTLTITPCRDTGMYWDTGHSVVEITTDVLRRKTRRLLIEHDGERLNIVEHILVLRALGIDKFIIACESGWPPYDGSAEALWEAVSPFTKRDGVFGRRCTPKRVIRAEVSGAPHRWVEIHPSREPLTATVEVDYPKLGMRRETFGPLFEHTCLSAKALGWPTWGREVCRALHPLRLAPNPRNLTWVGEWAHSKVLKLAVRHRTLDILGALAVAYPKNALVCGKIVSHLGGHECDLALVQALDHDAWETF